MLTFLRKIRKSLIDSGSTQKYLLYAMGEITLVVIGILIALQINNWNERRKDNIVERETLMNIRSGLESSHRQLKMSIGCNLKAATACEDILDHFNKDLPYHDSLEIKFSQAIQWCTPTFRNAGYENLKTAGLHLVTNNSIIRALDIYNIDWLDQLASRQEYYFYNTASPILTELFETVAMGAKMKPFDYETLKESNAYRSILNTNIANRKGQINWYSQWLGNVSRMDSLISLELDLPIRTN